MTQLSSIRRILVLAAHPDDEILGCGATIRRLVGSGAEAHALVLGTGLAARRGTSNGFSSEELERLRTNARASADVIGFKTISFEDFPDNRMDSVDLLDVVQKINAYADKVLPDTVFTHHRADLNIDHRITYNAAITAFRPLEGCCVKQILCFETPSSTEWNFPYYHNAFSPNVFVNVESEIEEKIIALNCYETEVRAAPHPRSAESVRAIAQRWGSVAGFKSAEAFELILSKIL